MSHHAISLRLSVAANYASQIYTTLISILLIPLYLGMMGAEAYGLIAFFSMLQSWFIVLDLGLSLTIARESARYFGGALAPLDYRRLYRALSRYSWRSQSPVVARLSRWRLSSRNAG